LALFGVVALVAGTLALFLPETKGLALPTTIKEAEQLSRRTKAEEQDNNETTVIMNEVAANVTE